MLSKSFFDCRLLLYSYLGSFNNIVRRTRFLGRTKITFSSLVRVIWYQVNLQFVVSCLVCPNGFRPTIQYTYCRYFCKYMRIAYIFLLCVTSRSESSTFLSDSQRLDLSKIHAHIFLWFLGNCVLIKMIIAHNRSASAYRYSLGKSLWGRAVSQKRGTHQDFLTWLSATI